MFNHQRTTLQNSPLACNINVQPSAPLINVNNFNLYYGYGDNHALHNINMTIAKNEITALIGPSGCGKSTFLRCLNRMNDLIEGVKLNGSIKFKGSELVNSKIDVSELHDILPTHKCGGF